MIWKFSDGTTVELGGKVEGATLLAQRIRAQLDDDPYVHIWPQPSESIPVDLNDAALLDAWLKHELDFWRRFRGLPLKLTRPDDVPALPPPPWGDEPVVEGRIY